MRFGTVRTLAVFLCSAVLTGMGYSEAHRFDVKDSIEMTTFSNPAGIERNPQVCFSPNGAKFLVVTSRGDIPTDRIQSVLLMYDVRSVRKYLVHDHDDRGRHPEPQRLATIAAIPRAFATRPYVSVITGIRWSSDSRWVYFLGEDSNGRRRLYRANVFGPGKRALSPEGLDVRQFALNTHNKAVFVAASDASIVNSAQLAGEPVTRDAHVVTGLSLQQILFPTEDNGVKPGISELWEVAAKGARRVVPADRLGGPDIDSIGTRVLGLSPDGSHVITILPVGRIPNSWAEYAPLAGFEQRRIRPDGPLQQSPFNIDRVRAYDIIDLRTGIVSRLLDAPHAGSLTYGDGSMVAWSRDGHRIVATNTFLPRNSPDSSENARRLYPCAAASIDLPFKEVHCIVFSRDAYRKTPGSSTPLQLTGAVFDKGNANSIFLTFGYNNEGVRVTEHYAYGAREWHKVGEGPRQEADPLLSVYVQQDLNTPATLWAKDVRSDRSREILDPNPQFKHFAFGHASLYQWKDDSGRMWEGGLFLPIDYNPSKQYPLVIQTHGFEPFQFITDGRYPTAMAARSLASAGIAVLQMGYRYDHIGTIEELDDQLSGYRSAISHLSADGIVDSSRVGIIGFSRPAWHVEAALIREPRLFAAATIADGVDESYMQYMIFGASSLGFASEFEKINGAAPFGEGVRQWLDRALAFHLDKVSTPLRIEAIGPVSLLSEWETYSSLWQQGKPVDLIYIPNGQHILQSPLDRLASQQGNVDWFCFWLLGGTEHREHPLSSGNEIRRWEQMRSHLTKAEAGSTRGGAQ